MWPLPYPYCPLQYTSIYHKTNPLWPAIAISPHYFRHIVGTIVAFSIRHCPRYKKKRNGTQTVLPNTAGFSVTLNLQSQQSPPCCGDHPPQISLCTRTTDSAGYGNAPTNNFICSPTQHIWSITQHLIIVKGRHCFPLGPSMYYPFYIDIRFKMCTVFPARELRVHASA